MLALIILSLFGCSDKDKDEIAKEFNFYFSANETACGFIFYDVEEAPALTIENRIVSYNFDEQNILSTSSPIDFGWKSRENPGFAEFNFYNGDRELIINEEEKPSYATGRITVDSEEHIFTMLHFSDREECFSDDLTEESERFFDLIRKTYAKNE